MELIKVEMPEKSVCKMTFSASAAELEAASDAVYERTRADYTIKGFAKGQADRAQIEADRGEHVFWYDAINDLMDRDVPALYDAALAERNLVPVDEPVYDLVSVKKDEGFVATASVALQPELTLKQTTGFTAQCVTPATTDKEVEQIIERRRQSAAELAPHKGPAVKGNVVHLDYSGFIDNKQFPGGTAQNQAVELGSGRMIPGFEDAILGHKAGDEFEIHVTFPVQYQAKDLAGKPAVFKAKLVDVCVRQLPALNSDFAKKVGKVDTMDEFRAAIRKQIEDRKHDSAMNYAKSSIMAQLAKATEGELPSILVEASYQSEMQQFQQQLQMQRLSLDRYLSQVQMTRENFTARMHASAEQNTRVRMALLQIAQNEGLVPTDEDLDIELTKQAERLKKTLDDIKPNADLEGMRRSEAVRRAANYVIEHSTIEEK
jgi:trigger factor